MCWVMNGTHITMKKSSSAFQPKEKDVEQLGTASEKCTLIKSIVEKPVKSPRMIPNHPRWEWHSSASSQCSYWKRNERSCTWYWKEIWCYWISEEAPSKPSLIFPLPVDKSDSDSLISYVNQSLMTSSDGTKEVEWISFWYKNTWRIATKSIWKHP